MGVDQNWTAAFELSPADSDISGNGNEEFQNLKTSIRTRLAREHVFEVTSASGKMGWHKQGSARAFIADDAPTNKCDGSAALDADDTGCLWCDSDDYYSLRVWKGTAWEECGVKAAASYFTTLQPYTPGSGITVDQVLLKSGVVTVGTGGSVKTDTIAEKTASAGVTVDDVLIKDRAINVNTINENTAASGVTIDGVLLKDSQVTTDQILEKTPSAGVTVDDVLIKDASITVDTVSEKTSANGVSVDGMLVKDGNLRADSSTSAALFAITVTAGSTYNLYAKVPMIMAYTGATSGGDASDASVSTRTMGGTQVYGGSVSSGAYKSILLLPGYYRLENTVASGSGRTCTFSIVSGWGLPAGTLSAASYYSNA